MKSLKKQSPHKNITANPLSTHNNKKITSAVLIQINEVLSKAFRDY